MTGLVVVVEGVVGGLWVELGCLELEMVMEVTVRGLIDFH